LKTDATKRTLKVLRDNGWTACVVERFLAYAKPHGKRVDALGFGDILACRPPGVQHYAEIYLIQCCPGASHAEHKEKIMALPTRLVWKASGGKVMLVSWALRGKRGERKRWTMREEEL